MSEPKLTRLAKEIVDSCETQRKAEIQAILDRGKRIAEASELAKNFDQWCSNSFGKDKDKKTKVLTFAPSKRTLLNYCQVWRTFGPEGKYPTALEVLLQFDNGALFDLADCWQPELRRRLPVAPKAVTEALKLAKAGRRIDRKTARELILEYGKR
jgi:hypothetical protein